MTISKRKIIALACVMLGGTVQAQERDYIMEMPYGGYKTLKNWDAQSSNTSKEKAINFFEIKVKDWTIMLNGDDFTIPEDVIKQLESTNESDGQKIAQLIQLKIQETGVLSVNVIMDVAAKRINVSQNVVVIKGSSVYRKWFYPLEDKILYQSDFVMAVALAQKAAKLNGHAITISLENPTRVGGEMALVVNDTKAIGADDSSLVMNVSSYGQRYSGRDVVTTNYSKNLGNDDSIDLSYSKGLSALRSDSKGGDYNSIGVNYKKILPMGILSARANHTRYKSGGEMLAYDMSGSSTRLETDFEQPINKDTSVIYGAGVVHQTTKLKALDMDSSSVFGFGSIGVKYNKDNLYLQSKLIQGLGGTQSYNVAPLGGDFDPRFTALQADAKYTVDINPKTRIELAGAAQAGSKGTPGAMQFYGGGLERGRSYTTGNIAGHSGFSGSATGVYDINEKHSVYAGVDFAKVYQNNGMRDQQSSAFVGLRTKASEKMSYDIALTKGLSGKDRGVGVMFSLTYQFD